MKTIKKILLLTIVYLFMISCISGYQPEQYSSNNVKLVNYEVENIILLDDTENDSIIKKNKQDSIRLVELKKKKEKEELSKQESIEQYNLQHQQKQIIIDKTLKDFEQQHILLDSLLKKKKNM
jgi:hypothetical protein